MGGFNVRNRTVKKDRGDDDGDGNEEASSSGSFMSSTDDKPRKKSRNRKPKNKYAESYPSYIQVNFENQLKLINLICEIFHYF